MHPKRRYHWKKDKDQNVQKKKFGKKMSTLSPQGKLGSWNWQAQTQDNYLTSFGRVFHRRHRDLAKINIRRDGQCESLICEQDVGVSLYQLWVFRSKKKKKTLKGLCKPMHHHPYISGVKYFTDAATHAPS